MKPWIPIPIDIIESVDNERRIATGKASTLDGFAFAWLKSYRGAPLSQRQLAAWSGWSKRKASEVLNAVHEAQNEWADQKRTKNEPPADTENGPSKVNENTHLEDKTDQKRTRNGPVLNQKRTDRARIPIQIQDKLHIQRINYVGINPDNDNDLSGSMANQQPVLSDEVAGGPPPPVCKQGPQPQKGGTRGKNIGTTETRELWQALNEKRAKIRLGARKLKLTPQIARSLKQALSYATVDEILHAYDWFTLSIDARWWQDNNCDLSVFCRQKHIGEFVNKSAEWSIELDKQKENEMCEPF